MRYLWILLVVLVAPAVSAQEDELIERGRDLYDTYCAICHGKKADGASKAAGELEVPPTDLTRLSKDNDGEFPFSRVWASIDGRERVIGHTRSAMPMWGLGFQDTSRDDNQEDEVRGKILQLIRYLETLQQPGK